MDVVEKDVDVTAADGVADAALFHPEGEGPWPGVLVWPDAAGLRSTFRGIGRRLASSGYVVLVVNPFYRAQRAPIIPEPVDFGDPEHRAAFLSFMKGLSPDQGRRDGAAYVAFLDSLPQVDGSKPMGVQGYCMGGAHAFRTAAASGRIGAVASFHGGGLVAEGPESPHLSIPATRAEFLVAIADNDDRNDPAAKDTLAAAFADAGRPCKVEVYVGADHGWTVPDHRVYEEPSAERAWAELLDLYSRALA
jgi:carboxymethylenebutenolidase